MSGVGQLVTSGPLILALPVAAAAGAVTFLSPCVLPLVPGYLSFVTGMAGASGAQPAASLSQGQAASPDGAGDDPGVGDGSAVGDGSGVAVAARTVTVPAPPRGSRGRVVAGTALFVLGFSIVFVALGAALGGLGHLLTGHARLLTQVLGGLTIVLGFLFAGAFDRFSFAGRIVRPSTRPKAGLAGARRRWPGGPPAWSPGSAAPCWSASACLRWPAPGRPSWPGCRSTGSAATS